MVLLRLRIADAITPQLLGQNFRFASLVPYIFGKRNFSSPHFECIFNEKTMGVLCAVLFQETVQLSDPDHSDCYQK